jgi:phenylpyruvate tautomerase PptA (4-oxalocrotonate tautomerase family)
MPFVLIDLIRGRTEAQVAAVAAAVQRAQKQAFYAACAKHLGAGGEWK